MRVKNINGAGNLACSCGSWLLHWARYSGRGMPPCCSAKNCIERPTSGALIQRDVVGDAKWYVVPLCMRHNGIRNGALELSDHAVLVSAEGAGMCRQVLQRAATPA